MKPYEINDDKTISLTEEPYNGIVFKFGKVKLIEEEDLLRIQFEYDIIEGDCTRDEIFRNYIGDILVELIEQGLLRNDIVYTGGTD